MPEVTTDKRFLKMIKFLVASSERPIAKILLTRGFADEDRKEGWALLDRASGRHQAVMPSSGSFPTQYRSVVSAVDSWENDWFDVAEAALDRQFPTVYGAVFKNLSKTSGSGVLLTVRTFLDRLDALGKETSQESVKAMALLEKRGLVEARRNEARALLASLETAETPDAEDVETPEEVAAMEAEREAAMTEMWAWYKDWAKTARTVVKNRNFRVMLGLSQPHGSRDAAEDEVEPEPAPVVGP